ncbi:MAG: hypothetical protein GY816_04355 [Cytophagales bacterium]|nr:hypothetical protein [Cytophagales bacterium]
MVLSKETNMSSQTTKQEGTKTLEDTRNSKYESSIVSSGIILVMAITFVLTKGFLTKRIGTEWT